jgi:hypothetical protein
MKIGRGYYAFTEPVGATLGLMVDLKVGVLVGFPDATHFRYYEVCRGAVKQKGVKPVGAIVLVGFALGTEEGLTVDFDVGFTVGVAFKRTQLQLK